MLVVEVAAEVALVSGSGAGVGGGGVAVGSRLVVEVAIDMVAFQPLDGIVGGGTRLMVVRAGATPEAWIEVEESVQDVDVDSPDAWTVGSAVTVIAEGTPPGCCGLPPGCCGLPPPGCCGLPPPGCCGLPL